jgi:hypothetical protein
MTLSFVWSVMCPLEGAHGGMRVVFTFIGFAKYKSFLISIFLGDLSQNIEQVP